MQFKLPNGLVDGVDHFNLITITELTGKQQDYLVDRKLIINNIGHIEKILEDMIVSLENEQGVKWQGSNKDLIWKLPASDLVTILVKIRENTFGPRYYFNAKCEHCGHEHKNLRLDLDTLEVTPLDVKLMQQLERRTLVLPKSGKTVVLKPLYLKDLYAALKIAINEESKLISSSIALAVESIDGDTKIDAEKIRALPVMDLKELQEKLDATKLEGEIDTDIEHTCTNCKQDFKQQLNVYDPDFFSLSRGFKDTNT